jgi:predicted nucleic acid-binding protein
MPDKKRRIYVDACVFLSYVNGIPDRLPDIDAMLDAGRKGEVELITSTVSITEVAFGKVEQDGRELQADVGDKISALWRPGTPVRLVDFHEAIGDTAKQLMRESLASGRKLKPMDAIHLSTALHMSADEFVTYDERLSAFGPSVGFGVGPPQVQRSLPWGVDSAGVEGPANDSPTEPPTG